MSRVTCYKCYWPQRLCWCASVTPVPTRTQVVILMHPYEARRIKANTGRLTHLCLADSAVFVGEKFDEHDEVQALINDPRNYPVLLYPGRNAVNLSAPTAIDSTAGTPPDSPLLALRASLESRRLVVFVLDATWRLVRPMLRHSLSLQRLPRVMFVHATPSRYIIKKQPEPGCLSTLEAVHELLSALDRVGLEHYARPTQLLDLFQRMQEFQLRCTAENRAGPRRHAPKAPRPASPQQPVRPKRRRIFPVIAPA